jgi:hypothetical protein
MIPHRLLPKCYPGTGAESLVSAPMDKAAAAISTGAALLTPETGLPRDTHAGRLLLPLLICARRPVRRPCLEAGLTTWTYQTEPEKAARHRCDGGRGARGGESVAYQDGI